MDKTGFWLGLLSATTFGLIPLFTLPLLHAGYSVESALVYRFCIASAIMWPYLLWRGETIKIGMTPVLKILLLSSFYLAAVALFFHAFSFLPSGIVATIQFLYPVMVMLIMIAFFHEKFSWKVAFAVCLAISGVALISIDPHVEISMPENGADIFWGVTLSLLAGLANALYFVGIQIAKLPRINGLVMTFYVMVFGALFCLGKALLEDRLQWISSWDYIGIAFLLALVTAVISNFALIVAIKRIGSTMASILGVMEPVTAVVIGIYVFGEPSSLQMLAGMLLIIVAVLIVLLRPRPRKIEQ